MNSKAGTNYSQQGRREGYIEINAVGSAKSMVGSPLRSIVECDLPRRNNPGGLHQSLAGNKIDDKKNEQTHDPREPDNSTRISEQVYLKKDVSGDSGNSTVAEKKGWWQSMWMGRQRKLRKPPSNPQGWSTGKATEADLVKRPNRVVIINGEQV